MQAIQRKILLLTLTHPDFLPPVFATGQVLRDNGYHIHILTFDSYVPEQSDLGENIIVESVGRHHGISTMQAIAMRRKFIARAHQIAHENLAAIVAFCPFSFICGIKVKNQIPLIYSALEISDFKMKKFWKAPLSNLHRLSALRNVHKADLVATPSVLRSAWLTGRCHLDFFPVTVMNTAYLSGKTEKNNLSTFLSLVPEVFLHKKIILYTGTVNQHHCHLELVEAFEAVNDENSALIITGLKEDGYSKGIKEYIKGAKSKSRIQLLPQVKRSEMLALQENAHIGVCFSRLYNFKDVESEMIAPNKTGEYLSNGLYILGAQDHYLNPLQWRGLASLAETTSTPAITIALKEALQTIEDNTLKQRISDYVKDVFCMQKQLKPVIEFLEKYVKS